MPPFDLLNLPRPKTAGDILNEIVPGRAKDRVTRSKYPTPDISPEEEQGLLGKIGSTTLSGLSRIATFLDTPGSIVRGALKGDFDRAFGGVFDPERRVTGKELLGGGDDLGSTATGIGAEILLDPLTYLSFGTSAIGKAGAVASKAGLLPKATYGAGGKLLQGAGVKRATTTLRDILADPATGAWDIAKYKKLSVANRNQPLDPLLDEVLGGGARVQVPFTNFGFNVGGENLASAFDVLGHGVRYSRPVRAVNQLLNADVLGAGSASGQQYAKALSVAKRDSARQVRDSLYPDIREAMNAGGVNTFENPEIMRELQQSIEMGTPFTGQSVKGPMPAAVTAWGNKFGAKVRTKLDDLLPAQQEMGLPIRAVKPDAFVQHYLTAQLNMPRGSFGNLKQVGRNRQSFSTFSEQQLKRKNIFRNIPDGRNSISTMTVDPKVSGSKFTGGTLTDRADYLMSEYGVPKRRQAKALARYLEGLPDDWSRQGHQALNAYPGLPKKEALGTVAGAFTKHAAELIQNYETRAATSMDGAEHLYDMLAMNAMPANMFRADEATETIESVLVKAGLTENKLRPTAGAIKQMDARLGQMKGHVVPKQIADDAAHFMRGFTGPEEYSKWVDRYDQALQFFKVHALLRPNFFTRNFTGGLMHNIMLGLFDRKAYGWTRQLLDGDTELKGLADAVPAYKGLTDAQATDQLTRSLFADAVITRKSGVYGDVLTGNPSFLGDIPGTDPVSLREILKRIGQEVFERKEGQGPLTRFNPLNVAGVASYDNVYAPAKLGDVAGYYTESLNRIPAYIAGLQKGYDGAEIANKVRLAHVDYNNLTRFEREKLRRLIPFYTFTKGMAMWSADQLMRRPGGALAQTMRGATRLRSDREQILPEHVSRTLTIPDPFGTPDRYFTGFGLMPEEALNLLGGDTSTVLGQLSPIVKAPMEILTGRSFFQAGPSGGRAIRDMDSPLQRIYHNLRGDPDARTSSNAADVLAMNILPTPITMARQLTGIREQDTATKKAINLLTGARVIDVSEAQQDAVLREATEELLRQEGGARTLERVWIDQESLDRMSPSDRERALKLMGLLKTIGERAKARAEAKKSEGAD